MGIHLQHRPQSYYRLSLQSLELAECHSFLDYALPSAIKSAFLIYAFMLISIFVLFRCLLQSSLAA